MADSDREPPGVRQQIPVVVQSALSAAVIVKDEMVVSSSTAMETDSARDTDNMATENLPQTYRASPEMLPATSHAGAEMMPDTGAETLPQTGITTVYTTEGQAAYTETDIPRTYVLGSQSAYLAANIAASDHLSYIDTNVPASSLGSAVMTQGGYVMMSHPEDIHKIRVSLADDVSRIGTPQDDDVSRMSVAHIDMGGSGLVQAGDVSEVVLPHSGDVSIVSVPYAGDVSGIGVPRCDASGRITFTGTESLPRDHDSKVHISHTDDAIRVHISQVPTAHAAHLSKYAETDMDCDEMPGLGDVRKMVALSGVDVSTISTVPAADDSKISTLTAADVSRMSTLTAADVGRMSTLTAADVGRISTLTAADVSRMSTLTAADVGRMSTLTASDVGRMSTLTAADVGRISTLTAADVSRISSLVGGDVSRISSLTAADLSKISTLTTADISRLSSLPASYVSRISDSYLHTAGALVEEQLVDTKPIILPQTGNVSTVTTLAHPATITTVPHPATITTVPHTAVDVNRMHRAGPGDIVVTTLPQTSDIGRLTLPQTVTIGADGVQSTDLSGMSIYQSGNVVRISLPVASNDSRVSLPQDCDDAAFEMQQKPDVSRLNLHETGSISMSMADLQQKLSMRGINVTSIPDIHAEETLRKPDIQELSGRDMSAVGVYNLQPSPSVSRTSQHQGGTEGVSMPQMGESRVVEAHQVHEVSRVSAQAGHSDGAAMAVHSAALGVHGDSVTMGVHTDRVAVGIHTDDADVMRMQEAAAMTHGSAAHYSDPNMMTLPQTSDVRATSASLADDATASHSHSHSPRQSSPGEAERLSLLKQPHAKYIKMKMVAEAAELARNSMQADDINMRLMAETADFVSRNVPQPSSSAASGNTSQAQNMDAGNATPSMDIPTSTTAQNYVTAGVRAKATEGVPLQNYFRTRNRAEQSEPTPREERGGYAARTGVEPTKSLSDTAVKEKDKELLDPVSSAGVRSEYNLSGLQSRSYSQWKEIGKAHSLFRDEDIACFLMRYYENASQILPASGSTTCITCQRQLAMTCLHCQRHGDKADDSGAEADAREDHGEDGKEEDADRTKLWKLILEAGSKGKEGQKVKEAKAEKPSSSRRKPRLTRRVLRRREKDSLPLSSDESPDVEDAPAPSIVSPPKGRASVKQEKKATPTMVTRKRGRPSRESYHAATTLDCPNCQKKFHTAVGLDQHMKRNRCKASGTPAAAAPVREEVKKNPNKSLIPSQFQCPDCDKQYRSKQGLSLHRSARHGEASEKLQSAVTDGEEDGEDTDEYMPSPAETSPTERSPTERSPKEKSPKDRLPKKSPGSLKKYRSRQGLMQHQASEHGEPEEKKVKYEEKEGSVEGSREEREGAREGREGSREGREGSRESVKAREPQVLECKECNKKYTSRPGYMLHIRTKHSPQVMLECDQCHGQFKTKVELRIHIRRDHHQGQLMLFCPYCPQTFHQRQQLRGHMDDSHKTCRRVLYDCFACDLQFSSRIERKRHIQSEHKGKDTSITCHFCGGWFATRLEYTQHEREGHPEETQSWLCATCGDSFQTRYLLQRHALSHKDKVMCKLCHKSITEPCFEDHMKRHYGNKIWSCELCPKSFIRKAELQQHMLVHKDERPFCCELCGMRYREKSRLNSHMRTHTGLKPYQCQQCEKAFTRSRELKNHMRVHTGEKPFSCTVCGRKFASSGNLSAHRRKVHKLEPIPHGQQSRKHTLEEKIKPENSVPVDMAPVPLDMAPVHLDIAPVTTEPPPPPPPPPPPVAQALEIPEAHSAPVAHQAAPAAHQAPMAHQAALGQQDSLAVYPQHLVAKYEDTPEHFIPQPVVQPPQTSLPMYWPNASYGEES